jgi:hypothetical protein
MDTEQTIKDFCLGKLYSGLDVKAKPLEYKSGALQFDPRCSLYSNSERLQFIV